MRSLYYVTDGDATHRSGAALRTALVGRPLRRFDAPGLFGPLPTIGRLVERVESQAKDLNLVWDDGIVLHTRVRLNGAWHLYRAGERWRKPNDQMRVAVEVPGWVAVCFNAATIETYREFDPVRHPGLGRLAPDLSTATEAEISECIRLMFAYADEACPIAEVLLDQHVARGVGNVYRSEVLWACELNPFAAVSALSLDDCTQVINAATRLLRTSLDRVYRGAPPELAGGLAVYGRNGTRCARCGDTIQVRRVGQFERLLYFCPGCQVRHQPLVEPSLEPPPLEMDPHPAATMFNADLPWRRDSVTR